MVHCAIDVVYIYQNYQVSVNLLRLTVVDATRRKRISDNNKRWWQGKRCITASTTHKVSRQSAITSVENCVITLSSPSTMLPMNGCRMCVRSVDDRCAQYSDTALTAEIRTHGGWDGFTPATVACRNLQKIGMLSALYRCKKIFWLHTYALLVCIIYAAALAAISRLWPISWINQSINQSFNHRMKES